VVRFQLVNRHDALGVHDATQHADVVMLDALCVIFAVTVVHAGLGDSCAAGEVAGAHGAQIAVQHRLLVPVQPHTMAHLRSVGVKTPAANFSHPLQQQFVFSFNFQNALCEVKVGFSCASSAELHSTNLAPAFAFLPVLSDDCESLV
jgi:hypothetical protein